MDQEPSVTEKIYTLNLSIVNISDRLLECEDPYDVIMSMVQRRVESQVRRVVDKMQADSAAAAAITTKCEASE